MGGRAASFAACYLTSRARVTYVARQAGGASLVSAGMERVPQELPLGRLEAFSDGVFAIAITLLVLELGVSADAHEHLLRSILDEWPSYLAYITSFLTIGVIWMQHSAITHALPTP